MRTTRKRTDSHTAATPTAAGSNTDRQRCTRPISTHPKIGPSTAPTAPPTSATTTNSGAPTSDSGNAPRSAMSQVGAAVVRIPHSAPATKPSPTNATLFPTTYPNSRNHDIVIVSEVDGV